MFPFVQRDTRFLRDKSHRLGISKHSLQIILKCKHIIFCDIQHTVPLESMKMAMTVVATGPIVLLYPFVQRYYVKGLTIGAVNG